MSLICPLFLMAAKRKESQGTESEKGSAECIKGKCAWYVSYDQPISEGCAIMKISDSLKYITLNLPR